MNGGLTNKKAKGFQEKGGQGCPLQERALRVRGFVSPLASLDRTRGSAKPRSDPTPGVGTGKTSCTAQGTARSLCSELTARRAARPAAHQHGLSGFGLGELATGQRPPQSVTDTDMDSGSRSCCPSFQRHTGAYTHGLPTAPSFCALLPRKRGPRLPPAEGSRSNDKDRDPLEEKAESTEDTPESLLPLLADGRRDSEQLRLSSSGPSRV